ncbi:MAG: hypothetical protein QM504_17960 [Pseudomonadota bacterium]
MKIKILTKALLYLSILSSSTVVADSNYPIAGSTPWQRPEIAPKTEWVQHKQSWYRHALTGINQPYPRSIYFLDHQGNWYTPFNHPGMMPPYDPRGWHQ